MDILKIRALILGPGYICSLAKARLFVLYGVFDVWNGLIEALQFGLIKNLCISTFVRHIASSGDVHTKLDKEK